MRVLVAPDDFAGTLSAVQAAEAIAEGWRRHAPDDVLDLAPMSDGGPGFVDVLHASLGGELVAVIVSGPHGEEVPATVLVAGDTAYVESAQACGLHLTGGKAGASATTAGVATLLAAAAATDVRRVVVGLGGSGSNDAGAGLLGGLGATADVPLDRGGAELGAITRFDPGPSRAALAGVELVAAVDVDSPLAGLFGATKTLGAQRGIGEERLAEIDGQLERFAAVVDRRLALTPGAGAAGGLGYGLLLLGATPVSGIELVTEAVGLTARAQAADLVVTGEGAFDFSSRAGKVPYGVAAIASEALRPCVAIAGKVLVGAREMRALGMDSAYALVDVVGEQRAFADPAGALADTAARVARTWS